MSAKKISLSKKSAQQFGTQFADTLHSFSDPIQRGAVISVYHDFIDLLEYNAGAHAQRGYFARLDEVEPLPTSKRDNWL